MLQLPRVIILGAALLLAACAPIPPANTGGQAPAAATPAPAPTIAPTAQVASTPASGTATSQLANPASVHCVEKSGQVVIVTDAQGNQSGMCVFPDGSQCDEWAFYRGECQPDGQLASGESQAGAPKAALQNGEYELPDIGSVQLKDGKLEQKTGEGATQVTRVGLNRAAAGDLNGDGSQDAVAELWANTGGTGVFEYLVALLNKDGSLRQAAASLLGDRVQVTSVTVLPQGLIVVNLRVPKAGDPLCCPSQAMTRTYQLEGNTLELVSEVAATPAP